MNLYWGAAASFVFFLTVGLIGAKFLHLEGPAWYLFVGLLSTLGISAAAFFAYFQRKAEERKQGSEAGASAPAAAGPDGSGEPDQIIKDADARLAQSAAGAGIANLPAIFVTGDRSTAKTSIILNSGLEPELLAGQIYQDNAIVPTRAANIFFARGTVFVEAGGALMANPAAWTRLIGRLQPRKLKSVAGGGQAPRGVLLCFDLETFARPGAADAIASAARYLQERLGEISQILGISFPVYVLFTRADRLPFFAEFVRNLTAEEAGQVVGATLPIRIGQSSGVYAEVETQRLAAAFNQLFHSFCDQRLRLLPRETDLEKVPGAYEFPREFRKLRNALVQFLVDIGRPSQLRASPFLRGFYFSGVRPVVVEEMAAAPLMAPSAPAEQAELSGGATRMFRAGMQAEKRAQQAVAQQASGARKVPQWLFLGHLFNDVILADDAGRAASGSSVKTSMLKRVLFASAAGLCLLYSVMLLVSFFGNRTLEENALTAARNIAAGEAAGANLPSENALRRLDVLRHSLEQLTNYEVNGAPFRLRWGLYSGSAMLPSVRRIYYDKFRQLLFGSTQGQMLAFLQRTPAAPGPSDDYGYAYDTLKSYLLTTAEWKRSSDASLQAFLGSRLLGRWSGGRDAEIGKDRMDLAKLQFDFYARDLHNGNPYSSDASGPAVDRSRLYLSKFSGVQRVYQFLLAEGAKKNPPASFNQKFPGTADVVDSKVEVAWAYTRDGWKFMQDQIKRQNFGGEQWVLGPYMGQGLDQASMEKGILDLYTRDYIEQWRNVLRRSNVVRYTSYQDASSKLTLLTGSSAPLLALFWWVSQNTSVDLPGVADKFKAVQAVVPPSGVQQYIVPPNQGYNASLMNLQQAVDKTVNKEPEGERATRDQAQSASLTTRQLAATFPPDPEAHVEARSQELLLQPITYLDGLAGGDLRAGGAAFCGAFAPLTSKFPFNSVAQPEVTLDELGNILRPKTGRLWTFYDMQLKNAMPCPNGECQASGNPPLNPAFVKFISQMMKFSKAVYGDAGTEPNLRYTLRAQQTDQVEQFETAVNGDTATLKGGEQHAYVWPGPGTRTFRLSLKLVGGTSVEATAFDGTWGVFRFFADANRNNPSGSGYIFTWVVVQGLARRPMMVNGRPLTYEFYVDTGGGPAVFSKDFLSTLKCVLPVSR
jgi:type VI secretion system protein ImpL